MAPEPERIYTVCQALLSAVVDHHGGTLPARQYVSAGAPAFDCELLATWCERTEGYDGNVAAAPGVGMQMSKSAGFAMRVGTFVVTLVRCTPAVPDSKGPKVALPTVAQEEDASETLYGDSQRVLNALVTAHRAGALSGCHSLMFMEWAPIGPEGGMVAGELRVRIGLVVGA